MSKTDCNCNICKIQKICFGDDVNSRATPLPEEVERVGLATLCSAAAVILSTVDAKEAVEWVGAIVEMRNGIVSDLGRSDVVQVTPIDDDAVDPVALARMAVAGHG